ncbi:MAG: CPBP family intramembrane glutamic endopeptidase, partial [Oscillospiraceae bacterium]
IFVFVLKIATYNFFSASLEQMPMDTIVNLASYVIEYSSILIAMILSMIFLQVSIKMPIPVAFSYKSIPSNYSLPSIAIMIGLFFAITLILDNIRTAASNIGIHFSNDIIPLASTPDFMVYVVFSIIALPVMYEYFFRGIILQSLRIFGDGAAIVISAIFATIFYYNTGSTFVYFIFSLCAGFFVIKSGSLSLSITSHITIATIVTILAQLKEINPINEYYLIKGVIFIILIAMAIGSVLFLLKTRVRPFYIQKPDCPFSFRKKLTLTCLSTYSILVFIVYFASTYYFIR